MSGVFRVVPKIRLGGFEHEIFAQEIRLKDGVLQQEPPAKGTQSSADAARQEAVQLARQQLQGTWRAAAGAIGGSARRTGMDVRFKIAGDKIVMDLDGRWEGTFTLDPTQSPKRINLTARSPDGKHSEAIRGVFEVRGDDLCVCLAFDDDTRPDTLRSAIGSRQVSLTLRRER
jgi:uncharacterized protein (TIGR03067 family)